MIQLEAAVEVLKPVEVLEPVAAAPPSPLLCLLKNDFLWTSQKKQSKISK
jgi:hypothetical protein